MSRLIYRNDDGIGAVVVSEDLDSNNASEHFIRLVEGQFGETVVTKSGDFIELKIYGNLEFNQLLETMCRFGELKGICKFIPEDQREP